MLVKTLYHLIGISERTIDRFCYTFQRIQLRGQCINLFFSSKERVTTSAIRVFDKSLVFL